MAVDITVIPVFFYHRFPEIYCLLEFFPLNLSGRVAASSPCDQKRNWWGLCVLTKQDISTLPKVGHFFGVDI